MELSEGAKRAIKLTVALTLFIDTLDVAILNNAIPVISGDLNINPLHLKVALTTYLLGLSLLVPIGGCIADRYGSKNIFLLGAITFTVFSILCGMSNDIVTLSFMRFFQGMGGAVMVPIGRLILLKAFKMSEMIAVTSYVTIPSLLGPALGLIIGGVIVTYMNWRMVFFINVPFGLLAIYLIDKYIPNYHGERTSFDVKGFLMFVGSMILFSLGAEGVSREVFDFKLSIVIMALAAALLVMFYKTRSDLPNSIINPELFKYPTFRFTVLGSLSIRSLTGGITFLLPLLFQIAMNLSPMESSLIIVSYVMGMITMKFLINKIIERFGFKATIIVNTPLLGLSLCSLAFISSDTPLPVVLLLVFLNGFTISSETGCINVLTFVELPKDLMSIGASVASTVQQFSMSIGVSVSALLLHYFQTVFHTETIVPVDFMGVFIFLGLAIITSTVIFMRLPSDSGHSTLVKPEIEENESEMKVAA